MSTAAEMTVIEQTEHGRRRTLRPVAQPGAGEVRVRVLAAALTAGEEEWPEKLPAVPAHDLVGIVDAIGDGVDRFAVGDRVFGVAPFDGDGALADLAVVPAHVLATAPERLTVAEAVVLPLGASSAWEALVDVGGIRRGHRLLVLGGAGGVGAYAVQLGARFGARVTATCRAADVDRVRALGAADAVDYAATTPAGPFDLVIDTVGGPPAAAARRAVAPGGRLVSLAAPPEDLDDGVHARYFVVSPNGARAADLARMADDGDLVPAPFRTVRFDDPALLDEAAGRPAKTAVTMEEGHA